MAESTCTVFLFLPLGESLVELSPVGSPEWSRPKRTRKHIKVLQRIMEGTPLTLTWQYWNASQTESTEARQSRTQPTQYTEPGLDLGVDWAKKQSQMTGVLRNSEPINLTDRISVEEPPSMTERSDELKVRQWPCTPIYSAVNGN